MSRWRRNKPDADPVSEEATESGVAMECGVAIWRDEHGMLLTGAPEAIDAVVDRLTRVTKAAPSIESPVVPGEALAVFATGYADGATASQYVRFTPETLQMLDEHGASSSADGEGFLALIRGDDGRIVGNVEWVTMSGGTERALAMQSAAIGLALRTAVNDVASAVARVEDKVDEVVAMLRAERLGNVLGDRRTLDALVGHLDAGDPLTSADWESVAALGPAITRDLEKLRAHLRSQVEEIDGGWRPRGRAAEADQLLAEGLLGESIGLLLLAEHNFSQWHRLRIQRVADTEPGKLDAAIRHARLAMDAHLEEDREFVEAFVAGQRAILEPRDHDGFAPLQSRVLSRAENELVALTSWFTEQRLLDVELAGFGERPGARDSLRHAAGVAWDASGPVRGVVGGVGGRIAGRLPSRSGSDEEAEPDDDVDGTDSGT